MTGGEYSRSKRRTDTRARHDIQHSFAVELLWLIVDLLLSMNKRSATPKESSGTYAGPAAATRMRTASDTIVKFSKPFKSS